jgi:hypothetical protein
MNELTSVVAAADHAARMNDRWLAIAMGLILLGVFAMVVRFLLGQNAQQRLHLQAMHNTFIETLHRIAEESRKSGEQLAVMVDRASKALDNNTLAMATHSDEMRRLREHCQLTTQLRKPNGS